VVVLPYNMLLHQPTRQTLGIDPTGHIIIIDEAHNIIDTISNLYSPELSGAKVHPPTPSNQRQLMTSSLQIVQAHVQLSQYLQRYDNRLLGTNKIYIQKILFFLNAFIRFLHPTSAPSAPSQTNSSSSSSAGMPRRNYSLWNS